MNKNILYVGFFALPDKDAAANRVMNNAKALREAGNNIIFIDEQVDSQYSKIEESVHTISGFDTWTTNRPQSLTDYLKKMISINSIKKVVEQYEKIDLIIAYNYPAVALLKLLYYCKKNEIKLAVDTTEWYSGKEYSFPKNVLCAIDSCMRMRFVQKQMSGIICISSYLERYYSKNKNAINIPPLIDIEEEIWNPVVKSESNEKLKLVYAGNPGKSKEVLLPIVQAISESNNASKIIFKIVGITKKEFLNLYPDSKQILNKINNSITFLGKLSHIEAVQLVKEADYMVFLRDNNRVANAGFSTKFVEAVTCGTSVVTTDTGDLKKIIDATKSGIIVQNTNELLKFLNQDIEYLKKNAFIADKNVFDYRNYIKTFEKWIKNM